MITSSLSACCKAIAPALGNHLWQSTLFAITLGLLTLLLRNNQARIRYWLWLAASAKFLIPFSLLAGVGSRIAWWRGPAGAPAGVYVRMDQFSEPFSPSRISLISETVPAVHSASLVDLFPALLAVVWCCGITMVVLAWFVRWRLISAAIGKGVTLEAGREVEALRRLERAAGRSKQIEIRVSRTSLEPGIFGVVRPTLVWPQGVSERLGNEHLEAILAHELCHVRRHDNLSAAMHMVVEAIFWFHPVVWWLGARLLQERERACDEQVLDSGSDRRVYAESILKICEFCAESPLGFVSGITGADLEKRIAHIMTKGIVQKLDFSRKILLGVAGLVAVAAPVVFGLLDATYGRAAWHAQNTGAVGLSYEHASIAPSRIKPDESGSYEVRVMSEPGEFSATNLSLKEVIRTAYGVKDDQISGAPDWLGSERYNIQAKASSSVVDELRKLSQEQRTLLNGGMLQALLADRLKLTFHRETRNVPVYRLVVAEDGPRLQQAKTGEARPNGLPGPGGLPRGASPIKIVVHREGTELSGEGASLESLASVLSQPLGRTVLDGTGLAGKYDFTLRWSPNAGQSLSAGQQGTESTSPSTASERAISRAIQQQLGLRLEPDTSAMEVLVIDHVEKPGDAEVQNMGATAPVIEVASVKPGISGAALRGMMSLPTEVAAKNVDRIGNPGDLQPQDTYARAPVFLAASVTPHKSGDDMRAITAEYDELRITNFTLRMLILKAYGVQGFQVSGGPDWLDSENYDIEAKMGSAEAEELRRLSSEHHSLGTLRMLQALLADRFNLALHRETEQIPVYALVIAKGGPKFREGIPGDTYPNGITGLYGRPIGGGGISEPQRGKLVGQGCPIAYLVEALSQEEVAGLGRVVVNKTGLAGNYDFTLQWTPEARPRPENGPQAKFNNHDQFFNTLARKNLNAGAKSRESDSTGLSVFTAIQEQLGLKLESQTRPVEFLVIDHAAKPTEN